MDAVSKTKPQPQSSNRQKPTVLPCCLESLCRPEHGPNYPWGLLGLELSCLCQILWWIAPRIAQEMFLLLFVVAMVHAIV